MIAGIIVAINFFTLLIGFLSSTGPLIDPSQKFYKFITARGYFVICCGVLIVSLPVIQYHFSEQEAKKENDEREKRIKLNYEEKTKDIIKSLANYGLKYNEAQKVIERLVRDSMRTTIIQSESPTLILSDEQGKLGIKQSGRNAFVYYFYSKDASSKKVNITASFIVSKDLKSFSYNGKRPLLQDRTIAKDYILSGNLERDTVSYHKYFYIWFRGTYMNNSQTVTFYFDEMLVLDNDINGASLITGDSKKELIRMINNCEKIKK